MKNAQPVHPALQQIHDLLYLDRADDRDVYVPEKQWDVDMLSMIADVVAEYLPRPVEPTDAPEIEGQSESSSEPAVIVTVSGGLADVLAKPQGVGVAIYDYDVEGQDEGENRIFRDPDGHACSIARWPASEAIAGNTHWPAVQAAIRGSYCRDWQCPHCRRTAKIAYEDLAEAGAPLCPDCDRPMELL